MLQHPHTDFFGMGSPKRPQTSMDFLIVYAVPNGEAIANCSYGTHLKNWQWKGLHSSPAWDKAEDSEKMEVAYAHVQGTTGQVRVKSKAWDQDGGVVLEIETEAMVEESEISSSRFNLSLPSAFWEGGQVELNAKVDLPPPGSTMAEGCSLFTKPVTSVQNVNTFAFFSKSGACLKVQVMESPVPRVNFVDVRKWGPQFEIRIGEQNNVTHKLGDKRKWRVHFSIPNVGLRIVSLKASLTTQQKKHLKEQGYIQLSDIIPREMVIAALKTVNRGLGRGKDPKKMDNDITHHSSIGTLVNNTCLRGILESLLGGAANVPEPGGAQVALVFPHEGNAVPTNKLGHHIDGLPTPTNGVEKGRIHNFTLLIGVYLSDTLEENCGNFTVFPGTHVAHANWFKTNQPESLLNSEGYMGKMPDITKPHGVQIKAKAGDIIIAHYLLAHSIATNVSPNIRYALYFRITSGKQQENAPLRLQEPFLDWPGL